MRINQKLIINQKLKEYDQRLRPVVLKKSSSVIKLLIYYFKLDTIGNEIDQ